MTDARKTILPPIGRIPPSVDAETKKFLGALKEHAEVIAGRRGDTTDRAVTHRDIEEAVAAAVAAQSGGSSTSAAKSLTTEDILALLEGAITSDELDEELNARLDTLADDTDAVSDTLEGNLEALSELAGAADKTIYFTGPETLATTTLTSFARTLIDDATAADARSTLDAQQHDADLDAVAALTGYGVPTRQTDNSWVIDTTPVQNGFENRTDSTITFTDGTLTLAIAPVSANFVYWASGQKYTKTTSQTVTITDTEGLWYIYFVAGTLTASQTFSDDIITTHAFVATLYWDATNNTALFVGDERHGREMDSATHLYLHTTNGAQWSGGLAPNNLTVDGSGNSAASAEIGVDEGSINDEDIKHSISAKTFPASIPFLYRSGSAGDWRSLAATGYVCTTTGTGRAAYNQNTGATWQLTEVSTNNFMLMHLYATNAATDPLRWVVGQNEYTTLALAQAGATTEILALSLGSLQAFSAEFHPIATFILQTVSTYTNAVKSRIRSTDTGASYIDWREEHTSGGAGTATTPGGADTQIQYNSANTFAGLSTMTTDGTAVTLSGSSANPMLKITQTGAGPCFLVEDSASVDATPVAIDTSGRLLVGSSTALTGAASITAPFELIGTNASASSVALFNFNATASSAPTFQFHKSAAAAAGSHAIVASNETVGVLQFAASDGSNYIRMAQITAAVDGTPGTNDMPGSLRFSTTADGASSVTERLRIDSAGLSTFTGNAVINTSSASDALRITQTGAGNALVVEDSTNPDSTPLVIDASGNMILGYTASQTMLIAAKMQVMGTAADSCINQTRWSNNTSAPLYLFCKSRGASVGTRASVSANDALGQLLFVGDDGTNWSQAAQITASADGVPSTTSMPGRVAVATTPEGTTSSVERLRIDSSGFTQIRSGTFGYASAVRGTVTQATSKATAVTLNKVCGQITTHAAALADATTVSFTVNNTVVEYNDVITLSICTGATTGAYFYWISSVGTGTFIISIRNVSGGSLSEAITFNFAVTKVEAPPFARVTTAGDARVTTDGSTRVVQ